MKDMKAFKETLRLYLWATGIASLALTASHDPALASHSADVLQRGKFSASDTRPHLIDDT